MAGTNPPELTRVAAHVAGLLDQAGIHHDDEIEAQAVQGGRNNRLYRVATRDCSVALKWYFTDPVRRNRLGAEFEFCQFCWDNQIQTVPKPLAKNDVCQLGLYEWVDGEPVTEISSEQINSAMQFVVGVNAHRDQVRAAKLPDAAESCFRIVDHLTCIGDRLARLARVSCSGTALQRQAAQLIERTINPTWQRISGAIEGRSFDEPPLSHQNRCLSPSDFGFHNALATSDGTLTFLDFEYAGWDDPAKLVCDFFCQVERPIPHDHWHAVIESLSPLNDNSAAFRTRCELLLPVYRVKWACILLNEFLPEHAARREFSGLQPPSDRHLTEQLRKAQSMLTAVEH